MADTNCNDELTEEHAVNKATNSTVDGNQTKKRMHNEVKVEMRNTPSPDNIARKSPRQSEEIKEYAETTMNELLGWYGYDAVERGELPNFNRRQEHMHKDIKREKVENDNSPMETEIQVDTNGENEECEWCQTPMSSCNEAERRIRSSKEADKRGCGFCSDTCFQLSRRSSFKKKKICDWCRHTRHSTSFVDLFDGDQELQFCSEKCLCQYKMSVFCSETQEHLSQLKSDTKSETSPKEQNGRKILITPDLWLNDDNAVEQNATKREDVPLNLDIKERRKECPTENTSPVASSRSPRKSSTQLEQTAVSLSDQSERKRREHARRLRLREPQLHSPLAPTSVPVSRFPAPLLGFPAMTPNQHPWLHHSLMTVPPPLPPGPTLTPEAMTSSCAGASTPPNNTAESRSGSVRTIPPFLPPSLSAMHSALAHPMPGILPPNTLMVPIPVPVPFPFPLPIPIPVKTVQQLQDVLNFTREKPKSEPSTAATDTRSRKAKVERPLQPDDDEPPRKISIRCACCHSNRGSNEQQSSCTSCTKTVVVAPSIRISDSPSEGVMDLSTSTDRRASIATERPSSMERAVAPPPPMPSLLLLPPPQDQAYSSRRGRILDAPPVVRERSPSPERRSYHRTHNARDLYMRKGKLIRTSRIKTK